MSSEMKEKFDFPKDSVYVVDCELVTVFSFPTPASAIAANWRARYNTPPLRKEVLVKREPLFALPPPEVE